MLIIKYFILQVMPHTASYVPYCLYCLLLHILPLLHLMFHIACNKLHTLVIPPVCADHCHHSLLTFAVQCLHRVKHIFEL